MAMAIPRDGNMGDQSIQNFNKRELEILVGYGFKPRNEEVPTRVSSL